MPDYAGRARLAEQQIQMILAKYIANRFALSLATALSGVFLLYFILEIQKHMSQFRTAGISVSEAIGLSLLSVPAELYDVLR